MKRFISLICAAVIAVSPVSCFSADADRLLTPPIWMPENILSDNENPAATNGDAMLSEEEMGFSESYGTKLKYTNRVDGYSIVVPFDMAVDRSLSDICTVFSSNTLRLSVYKESFDTVQERESYLVYSNKFTENTADHTIEENTSFISGKYEYRILRWSRKKLSRIKNDKRFYACIDVCVGARVYTFFFASSAEFIYPSTYMDIVNSLETFDPIVSSDNAYNKGYKKTSPKLNTYAQSTYDRLFADNAPFRMGMFAPEKYGGFEKLAEFENALDYTFDAFLVYTEFPDKHGMNTYAYYSKASDYVSRIENYFTYAQSSKKAIELTLQTPLSRLSDSNMIYEILNGEYDQFLSLYAKLIARYPSVTVLFRPFNEMNCDWCNYSAYYTSRDPQLYVELYRYIYQIFKSAGCANTIWVWNPNEKSFPGYKWNDQSLYYPGDEYVDVYGLTGYNTGTYYNAEIWRSFDEIYAPIYARALRINEKPMMITEFSCSSIGGDKVQWINDMFAVLHKYDRIKLGIWWHAADLDGETLARPYFMDTPDGTLDAFKNNLVRE